MHPIIEKVLNWPLYQRVLLLCGLLALIVSGFVYGVFLPQREELGQLEKRKAKLQTKLQEDRRIAEYLPKFRAEFEKMERQLELALTELPNQKEIPALLTSVAGLAKDNGLDVLRFKPNPERVKGFYAEVPVQLKLVGSYHEVAMFFYDIGNMSRIVNMNNLRMGSAKMSGGRNLLSVECLATTFRFVENPPAQNSKKKGKKR
jgi:type IV pilus assembly protein PilO